MRICDVLESSAGDFVERMEVSFVWLDTDGGSPFVHSQSGDKLLNWTLLSKETPP